MDICVFNGMLTYLIKYDQSILLRPVICNRLVNLGISKQQHLYLKTEF